MLTVLRQRNFALLWFAALISRLGDYTLLVGLPFYVYQRTGSTVATGAMIAAELGPEIALGSLAGVYADRWDRRRTMIVADLARAGVLLLLLALPARGGLWLVYLVAAAQTSIAQFFLPASGALIPRIVGDAQLMPANALRATMDNAARVVGPAIGGALLGTLGLGGVVLVDATSFLCSAGLIVLVRVGVAPLSAQAPTSPDAAQAGARWRAFWREWADGLDVVRRDQMLTALFVVWGITMLAQGFLSTLWVPFVRGVLHGDAPLLGWIGTAQGIGGILGGLVVGRVGTVAHPRRFIIAGSAAAGFLLLALINVRAIPLILLLSVGVGVPVLLSDVSMDTLLQQRTADVYRGRVLGAYGMTGSLVMLASVVVSSALGERIGIVALLDVASGLLVAASLAALMFLPRTMEGRRDAPTDEGAVRQA